MVKCYGDRDCKKVLATQMVWRDQRKRRFLIYPVVGTRIIWPKSQDIGISYCRMLLQDTMLNKDSYRTGTSDTALIVWVWWGRGDCCAHAFSLFHMPEHSLISLWMISVFRQRTHGQLVTKPRFFWHHNNISKMLSSDSLTTLTGNYEDILLFTSIYQLQQTLISPMFVSSVTIVPIGVFNCDVSTSLELCSYW